MRARNSIQISNLHSDAEGSRKHTFRIFVSELEICYTIKHEFQDAGILATYIPISFSELMGGGGVDTQTRSSTLKYLFVIDFGWCGWMLSHLNT